MSASRPRGPRISTPADGIDDAAPRGAHQTFRRTANFLPGVPVDTYSQIEPVALFFLITLDAMTRNFQTNLYEQQKYTPSGAAKNIIVSEEKCLRMIAQANEAIP